VLSGQFPNLVKTMLIDRACRLKPSWRIWMPANTLTGDRELRAAHAITDVLAVYDDAKRQRVQSPVDVNVPRSASVS